MTIRRIWFGLAAALLLMACATTTPDSLPSKGVALVHGRAVDARTIAQTSDDPAVMAFHPDGTEPKVTPSLLIGARRTVRGGLGEIATTDKDSVIQIAGRAIHDGMTKAGYKLTSRKSPEAAGATPVAFEIMEMWIWHQPGSPIRYRADLILSTPTIPKIGGDSITVHGEILPRNSEPIDEDWNAAGDALVDRLAERIAEVLNRP